MLAQVTAAVELRAPHPHSHPSQSDTDPRVIVVRAAELLSLDARGDLVYIIFYLASIYFMTLYTLFDNAHPYEGCRKLTSEDDLVSYVCICSLPQDGEGAAN